MAATVNQTPSQRVTLSIYGLTCDGGGALTAERALARRSGVVRAYVNAATETAYVVYDPATVSPHDLIAAVEAVDLGAGEPQVRWGAAGRADRSRGGTTST